MRPSAFAAVLPLFLRSRRHFVVREKVIAGVILNKPHERRSLRMPMATRVLAVAAFALVSLTVALLLCARQSVERSMQAQITSHVVSANNVLAQLARAHGAAHLKQNGDLAFGAWVVSGDHSVVDTLKALTGADATLFEVRDGVPRRVTTTVLKLNSRERNDGTELSGPARVEFDQGRGFTGSSPVAGKPYFNRYVPIIDASGKTIGIFYSGVPTVKITEAINDAMRSLMIVAFFGLAILLGLLYAILRPLHGNALAVTNAARGLAVGDIGQPIIVKSGDELEDIASAFGEIIAYQERMIALAGTIASGDLFSEVRPASDRDRLALAFSRMTLTLRTLISGVAMTSKSLAAASDEASAAVKESTLAIGQIVESVEFVSASAQTQAGEIAGTATAIEELRRTAEQIAKVATHQAAIQLL